MATHRLGAVRVTARIAASLLGGYAFTWGFATLCIASLMTAGLSYGDARVSAFLLAFLVFLVAFLWAFAARSLARVWVVLAGGGAVMSGAAWLLLRDLA